MILLTGLAIFLLGFVAMAYCMKAGFVRAESGPPYNSLDFLCAGCVIIGSVLMVAALIDMVI